MAPGYCWRHRRTSDPARGPAQPRPGRFSHSPLHRCSRLAARWPPGAGPAWHYRPGSSVRAPGRAWRRLPAGGIPLVWVHEAVATDARCRQRVVRQTAAASQGPLTGRSRTCRPGSRAAHAPGRHRRRRLSWPGVGRRMASGREPVRNDTAAPPRRSAMGRPLLEGFRVGRGAGQLPVVAPAACRMPSVTMPTFSTPAPLAASMTAMISP